MTRPKLPWYKRNPKDYISATRELKPEERGIYNDLIELLYLRDRRIPDDARFLSGFVGVTVRKWNLVRDRLLDLGKIIELDGYLTNDRFERERKQVEDYRSRAAELGRQGGRKRAATAVRNSQGEFDLSDASRKENRGNPTGPPKGSPGENRVTADKSPRPQQNQSLKPHEPLEELDDSFLHGKTAIFDLSPDYLENIDPINETTQSKNGSFPPPSSKPARVRERASESRKNDTNVRASSRASDGDRRKGKPKPKSKRARTIPKDWQPSLTDETTVMVADWPEGKLERETARFRDHAAMNGRTLKDWDAGFRNWLRKEDDDYRHKRNRPGQSKGWASVGSRLAS